MQVIEVETLYRFDVRHVAAGAVKDVFDMMLDMEIDYLPEMEQPYLYGPRFLGAVELAGSVLGTIKIQAGRTLARRMTAAMLGLDPDEPGTEAVCDVVGELTNMVGGSVKSALCDAGLPCALSSPAITTGKDFKADSGDPDRIVYLTFYHQDMPFLVEVGLKQGELAASPVPGQTAEGHVCSDVICTLDVRGSVAGTIVETFDMMLGMRLDPTDPPAGDGIGSRRYVGSVSMAGQVLGRLNLEIGERFGRQMAAAMLGMDVSEIEGSEEIKDVVGELTNMLGGSLKSALCDAGLGCELSPPGFTSGSDFKVALINMTRCETFAYRWQDHVLVVAVGLKAPA